jgi:hypothetical protein
MKKNTWILAGMGAVAIALFFAYKKRNVPAPSEAENKSDEVGSGDISKRKELQSVDMQFYGMSGKPIYVKPQNLIPNVMDNNFYNADGGNVLPTRNVYSACKCASKQKPAPSILSNIL